MRHILFLVRMSAKRLALDTDRVKKALDLDLSFADRSLTDGKLSIESSSITDNTERMTVEENSLLYSNKQYVEAVLDDFKNDLAELEISISKYRQFLKKLEEKERHGN